MLLLINHQQRLIKLISPSEIKLLISAATPERFKGAGRMDEGDS